MKWDDFLKADISVGNISSDQIKTDIECPKCGAKVYFNSSIVLTTYPPQYSYWCDCGWHGTSFMRWR